MVKLKKKLNFFIPLYKMSNTAMIGLPLILCIICICCISSIVGGYLGYEKSNATNCVMSDWSSCSNGKQTRKVETPKSMFGKCEDEKNLEQTCQEEIKPEVVPKLTKGDIQYTKFDSMGGGETYFLDRQDVKCGDNKVLNQLHLTRFDENNVPTELIRYEYTCSLPNISVENKQQKQTTPSWEGNVNDVPYSKAFRLDQHDIDCGKDSLLSGLKLERDGTGKFFYKYECIPSNKPLNCRQTNTTFDDDGSGHMIFLDRHNLKCSDNEAISKLKLVRDGTNKYRYDYTCCSY